MAWGRTGSLSDPEALLGGLLRLLDVLVVMVTGYLAYLLRGQQFDEPANLPSAYLIALLAAGFLTLNVMHMSGIYRPERLRQPVQQVARSAVAWSIVLGTLLLFSALTQTTPIYSRVWFILWALFGLVGLVAVRTLASRQITRWRAQGLTLKRMAVVGTGPRAETVARQMRDTGDYDIVGLIATRPGPQQQAVLGELSDLEALLRERQIEEVVVAAPRSEVGVLAEVMAAVRGLPIDVRLVPELPDLELPIYGFDRIAGVPTLHLWRRPLSPWQLLLKALEDRLLAAVLLVLLSPLMLLAAIAIRLDSPGPILFRQRRAGLNNRVFVLLKFRSMTHCTDSETRVDQARRNDPRVTRVGALLRRSSVDELPQLINVLRGEMSLVGPRPHAIAHETQYSQLIADYLARQRMKPGITGWAQINGLRGETETPEKMRRRVQADLFYIENWSIWLDLRILFLTPFVALIDKNAY
ncbi:putative colanic acid biosysnthesis UDP-glucose lipid carrier transferase [Tistlia consotensis]|uniref:Putative colanic acid biosysnthesis UDP-glucose lipid carrier transferase n=1 Tax=Tistlia consotensis USBA 355 TaxID=560819 RepID=A0A1Y6CHM8_9PROT|nr:undecaprenyl-phosphate glucose phosphotransferase [Tistlia consotensis]SMF63079.1 putative colanic acid biosysnthesis UDP-glucose lipid carrier transferase [Tistlia consotensis USBA 355]SNR95502.1 putative colanic acid biosysnthesis UDP-glucose lipid carrier transferase [Tistlia consotensis]